MAVVVVVLLVVAVAVPLLVDADRLRPTAEAQLSQALARPVHLGKLGFSWMAGGVSAANISVGEDPAFGSAPFLTAKTLDVSVQIWPLILHRQLEVNTLTVRDPQVRLVERNGKWNVDSLGQTSAGQGAAAKPAPAPATSPSGSEEVPALVLDKLSITGARITVTVQGATENYTNVSLEADHLRPNTKFPFKLAATTPGNGQLQLAGTVGPAKDLSALPAEAQLKLDHLDLGASGYFGANSGLAGVAQTQAKLRSDGRTAHVEGTTTVEKLRLVKGASSAQRPVTLNYAVDYDLASSAGRITRGDLTLGKSSVHLSGGFEARANPAVVNATASTQGFAMTDMQDLLPAAGITLPGGASLQGGTAAATMTITGPVDRLIISGPVKLSNVIISGFDLGANLKTVAALAGIKTGSTTELQLLSTNLQMTPEGTTFNDINAVVAGMGNLTGTGTIAANNALNFRMVAKLSKGSGLLGGLLQQTGVAQLSEVPFRIEGTTANPKFVPDVGGMLHTKSSGSAPAAPSKNPASGLMNLFNKKK